MKGFRNYLTGFILLSLAAMPAVMAVRFVISCEIARHKAIEQLEKGNYRVLTLKAAQIQWLEEGKELLVDGKLFDVKDYRHIAGNIEVTGLFDTEEDELREKYRRLINNSTEDTGDAYLLKLFFTPVLIATPEHEKTISFMLTATPYQLFNEVAVSRVSQITTPPPQHTASV